MESQRLANHTPGKKAMSSEKSKMRDPSGGKALNMGVAAIGDEARISIDGLVSGGRGVGSGGIRTPCGRAAGGLHRDPRGGVGARGPARRYPAAQVRCHGGMVHRPGE